MKKLKIELQELKNDFEKLWSEISSVNEMLGLSIDENRFKKSLLEILYRANEIREELIETGLFVDGVSKIEYELDESDTLEKILTQFDNIITDIDEVLQQCELSNLGFKENCLIELLKKGYEILNVNDEVIYSYNIENDNLFITDINKYKNGEKSSDGIKLLDFITSFNDIQLSLKTLKINSGNFISESHLVDGYEICITYTVISFQDDIPFGDVVSTFNSVDEFEKDFPKIQKLFAYAYKKGFDCGSLAKEQKL